jgi:predicted DNA-binding antitoxin AbrB/MazE fold protein
MTITLQAIYEQGVLRLMQPINLLEGTPVEVVVTSQDFNQEGKIPADILAEIAALPLEGTEETFSGRDHDKILY